MLFFFFFHDTATTEIYTLSLHDALPICGLDRICGAENCSCRDRRTPTKVRTRAKRSGADRKSTRLNSSHLGISYAVFCLKKKKKSNANHTVDKAYDQTTTRVDLL